MPFERITMRVSGMVCQSCEDRIGKRISSLPGVESARASYRTNTLDVSFEPDRVSPEDIGAVLDEMGYELAGPAGDGKDAVRGKILRLAGLLVVILGGYVLADRHGWLQFLNIFPEAEAGMGYGMIFVVGLLTSAHCVAMCGGINLSQSISRGAVTKGAAFSPTLLYAVGRVISYAAIGGLAGGVGMAVSFSGSAKGVVQIAAGVFMVLMGLNLMGVFPSVRRLIPRLPRLFGGAADGFRRGPFLVGLLNGLMPCGPLQAMQMFALSTGSPARGALSMTLFALGTLPLTMGLGVASAYLGHRFTNAAIRVGAVLVFVMGVGMLMNGVRLAGFAGPVLMPGAPAIAARMANGAQEVQTELEPGAYRAIRVMPGVPLRWNMHVDEKSLNGCNNRLFIPAFGIEKRLAVGDNLIEFTPAESGVFPYTCWMGMIGSRIIVGDVEDSGVMPEVDASLLPIADEGAGEDIPWL